MDKVLVVKAIEPNYNTVSGGPPVMMVGGGRSRSGPAVGRTKRERLGGVLGGTVGVLGALGGQHRSLGSLVQAMISGGAQGKALGGAFGRSKLVGVGRQRQARADYDEEARRDYARMTAEGRFDNRRYDVNDRMNPATMRRRVAEVNREDELAAQQAKEAQAEEMARARRSGAEQGSRDRTDAETLQGLRDAFEASGIRSVDDLNQAFNTMRSATDEQGQAVRYDVDPTQGGNVAVRADDSPLGNVQDVVNQTLALPAPAGGANTEINDIESAGNTEAMNTGTDHERRSTVKVVNPKEDEEEERVDPAELGRIQAGLQQPGKRPPGQPVEVRRPTEQSSIYDLPGFEQGGN